MFEREGVMIMKNYVNSFIEGVIPPHEFLVATENNPEIFDWLQSVVPAGKVFHKCRVHVNDTGQNAHVIETVPYDIRLAISTLKELCRGQTWCTYYYVHREISDLWKTAFPHDDLVISESIKERFFFELEAVPRYVGGKDIYKYGILDEIIESLPRDRAEAERKQMCRELVCKAFHLDETNPPLWRREAEWPLGVNHKPMKFLYQNKKEDKHVYYFEDVETEELITVCQ